MKIAVMTWFSGANFGTLLQAAATKYYLESKGHQVELINYTSSRHDKFFKESALKTFIDRVLNKIKLIKNDPILNGYAFDEFRNEFMKFTDKCATMSELQNLNGKFDVFICGSDQIWSPLGGLYPHYYLDFVTDTHKMIAYAPSIGASTIENKLIEKKIKELASRFYYISTREKNGSIIIENLIKKEVKTVLDPTLLLDQNDWIKYLKINTYKSPRYLLAYFLGRNKLHWQATYRFAEIMGLELKIIPVFKNDFKRKCVIKESVGPKEFVEYFNNASFICTDSFHGTAFAINFNKEFCCFKRFKENDKKNQNSRILNILENLNLCSRLYRNNIEEFLKYTDYLSVNKKLEELRRYSEEYLLNSLKKVDMYNNESH